MQLRSLFTTLSLAICSRAALVTYVANVTVGPISPDGRTRDAWLINGQTPGPILTAWEGDDVSVKVINHGSEPITIHFHGIEQIGSLWADGVPGVTQYPIAVGHSFVYNWTASKSGAAWMHSHYKTQVDDGLRAPIFIRPKKSGGAYSAISKNPTDIARMKEAELSPHQLFVYDYKKYSSEYYKEQWNTYHVDPLCIDSILINGKGQVICQPHSELDALAVLGPVTDKGCAFPNNPILFPFGEGNVTGMNPDIFFNCSPTSTPLEVFLVTKAMRYVAFNLLNAGAVWDLKVSIDQHKMIVFAADGGYVAPQTVDTITIPIGERYQFFVPLDQNTSTGDFAVRVSSAAVPQMITGYATLRYADSVPSSIPTVNVIPTAKTPMVDFAGNTINNGTDLVPALLSPYPPSPPPGPSTVTVRLNISRPNEYDWQLNTLPWTALPDTFQPVLFNSSQVTRMAPNLYSTIPLNAVVDVIITVHAGDPALHPPHPIHKHGRKAYLLGSGMGDFPYANIAAAKAAKFSGINLVNPPLRDDFLTPLDIHGVAWVAFRFKAIDAGPFLMHCHIDPHMAAGMIYLWNVGPKNYPTIPSYYKNFKG